jgi:hypothetical protein
LLFASAVLFTFASAACTSSGGDDDSASADDDAAGDDDAAPSVYQHVAVVLPGDADPAVRLAAADAVSLFGQISGLSAQQADKLSADPQTLNVAVVGAGVAESVFTAAELAAMPAESFRLRTATVDGAAVIAIAGGDARGRQYGLYDLLERFGFRFFHPEQTYVPAAADVTWPAALDVFEQPDWGRRGFHFHTMHPIEASEFVLVPSAQHEVWAKHLIDWLARNKQNYWQFELLRTVDFDQAAPYFRGLVDYSHARLVDVGLVVTWVFQQQKAWKLLPDARAEHQAELQQSLDQLMQVPWDHLNLEMGGTEFTSVNDKLQVAWMNDTVAYLAAKYPHTTASVKVHCSSDQTAPDYGGINFNYLPQFADERMGIYPHTVMYYALNGPAPVYGNENYDALYHWMLSMIDGVRKVYYYPETAYWCSFDIDVPLFLPLYIFNRWNDMALLVDQGLDGQVTFTSGHEWSYWLSDWSVARFTWNSRRLWTDALAWYAKIFGDAGPDLAAAIQDLALAQQDLLIDKNLASYLAGEDTWDELGYLFGATTHPKPVMFSELYRMNEADVRALQSGVIADLADAATRFDDLAQRVEAARAKVPARALAWYDELADSFQVDQLRAAHAHLLWAGAAARRLNELGVEPGGEAQAQQLFAQAKDITAQFRQVVAQREASYRYPLFYSTGWKRSVTSYDFRYLFQASNAYWFRRYEKQAIDKDFNPFLMNLIDPIWFFF